jgi:hypothetical protein
VRYLPFLLIILFSACNMEGDKQEKTLLARVYDQYLYLEDLEEFLPGQTSGYDSIMIVQNFVNKWLQEQVIVHKAKQNLNEEDRDFSRQLEEYRKSLLIYTYESKVMQQYLDTVVSDAEIESHYDSHQENFELKDNIVKVNYVKIHQDSLEIRSIKQLLRSEAPDDLDVLDSLCSLYATDYWLGDSWLYLSELKQVVPIETDDPQGFLRFRKNIQVKEEPVLHLLHISEYKLIGDISPLELEWENIKKIIINNRKLELKKRMREELMEAALETNEVEVYQ